MIISIINQALILLPLIVGAYIALSLLKLPDFSLESSYLFGAVSAYLAGDIPLPIVIACALGGGAIVGCIVSSLNQFMKLPFLLAAVITNGLFHGLTQLVLGTSLKSYKLAIGIPEMMVFAMICTSLSLAIYLVLKSPFGYSLAIYGNNPCFFNHHGISGKYVVIVGTLLAHCCAGLSGFMFALSNGLVDLTMNYGIILTSITALILGKGIIRTHRPSLLVPLLGLFAFLTAQQTLLQLGLNLRYFNAFQAIFILITLCIVFQKKNVQIDHLGV